MDDESVSASLNHLVALASAYLLGDRFPGLKLGWCMAADSDSFSTFRLLLLDLVAIGIGIPILREGVAFVSFLLLSGNQPFFLFDFWVIEMFVRSFVRTREGKRREGNFRTQ